MLERIKEFLRRQGYIYSIISKFKAREVEKKFSFYSNHYHFIQKDKNQNFLTKFPIYNVPDCNKKAWGDLAVYFIDDNEAFTIKQMDPALRQAGTLLKPDWYKWVGITVLHPGWSNVSKKANKMLIEHIRDCHSRNKIDVIIAACYGDTLLTETLKELQGLGIPTVRFWMDDKQSLHHHLGSKTGQAGDCPKAHLFGLTWTTSKVCVKWIEQEGGKAIYLAEGANPELFYRESDTSFEYDVSFIGACYGIRSYLIHRLHKAGIKVSCFGPGWKIGKIVWEDMPKIINRSKINLGIGGVGHSFNLTCLKGRDFEIPMVGGFYLTTYNYELADWYDIGKEIVCYRNIDEAIEIIRFYLSNEDLAASVRQAGYLRARSEHTWEHRFKTVFRKLGIMN